jgi:hypothetical protein
MNPSVAHAGFSTLAKVIMSLIAFTDQASIVVGKPMPCSVYGADRKLLLAKGLPVTSERMREVILSQATYIPSADQDTGAAELPAPPVTPPPPAPAPTSSAAPAANSPATTASAQTPITGTLADLRRRYANDDDRSRFGLRIARDERSESFQSFVIGVVNDKRIVILTAPSNKDGSVVPINKDEVWLCRLFNATTVFRFMGKIVKFAREPLPHLHVELPKNIERRMVRRQPRALSTLSAALHKPDGPPGIIVDISVSGVRLAVEAATKLEKNAAVPICMSISMLDRIFQLSINGRITATFGASDTTFPDVHFYGVQFEDLNETAMLVLHAFVQEQLTQELDRLSRVLAIEAAFEAAPAAAPKKK